MGQIWQIKKKAVVGTVTEKDTQGLGEWAVAPVDETGVTTIVKKLDRLETFRWFVANRLFVFGFVYGYNTAEVRLLFFY